MQVQIQVLSQEEKQSIHEKSLQILGQIGAQFHSQRAREVLKAGGAFVDNDTKIAKFPAGMIEQALASAPKSFTLASRTPERDVDLPCEQSGYVLDNGGIYTRDHITGERRVSNLQDNIEFLKVFDEMPSSSIVWSTTVHEFQPRSAGVKACMASFMHSCLHVQDELTEPAEVPLIAEALECILGSQEAVRKRKIYSVVYCTLPPLGHDGPMCDAYLDLCAYDVPICIFPMPSAGSTGPASLFSNIAMGNAEALSALVLFQLARPGLPIIFGDASGTTDFRSGNFLEGTPETVLQAAARGEMARFYGLPNEQAGCLSDAKDHGPQAVMEKVTSTLPLVLSGVDLIQGPGALDTSNMMSLAQIVVDDEIARYCARIRQGVDVSIEKDYFDDILAVQPGGHFLGRKTTRAAVYSSEFLQPALSDRNMYTTWQELGRPDLYENAIRKVDEILASPQKNPLPDAVVGKLQTLMRKADEVLV
jgi:trimethylamine---corrinoid protein Co-methyltransferase